ncbi:MAG TPA: ankyrin repeat domain-containing protein [Chthonomonadaceae bacterium]|nr:ankyrin repeat domain-containing protein [Chthonomonadaceae bacterium]
MTTPSPEPAKSLPDNPDLRHLKDEARDLLRSGGAQKLSEAQFRTARAYGFASWPRLKAHVDSLGRAGQLKAAIDANDLAAVQDLMTRYPDLHRAPLGYGKDGPLTWAAECRVPRVAPGPDRLAIARWMLENGSDVHQGGDGPLMRAALDDDRIAMMELLVSFGADVNAQWHDFYPIVCAPCETLAPGALRWLLAHGADPNQVSSKYGSPLSMVIGTYSRRPGGKHACLQAFIEAGFTLPDTPAMAFHRGRIDLLEAWLDREPSLLDRTLSTAEIFPPDLGLGPTDGLHLTPISGVTLLHLAIEYDEMEIARLLLGRGANVDARAEVDADGFGGHTALFHAVVSLGRRDAEKAHLLLEHGADPNARATLRKQLVHMGDPELERMHEFHGVTPIGYARRFQVQDWSSEPAIAAIAAAGGAE